MIVRTSDIPLADMVLEFPRTVWGELTIWSITVNGIWSDDAVGPGPITRLKFLEIVLLVIVEIVSLVIVSRERLFQGDLHRPKMHTIILFNFD